MKHDHLSKSALIAIFALVVLSLIGGWIIVSQQGFSTAPYPRSQNFSFVDGPAAAVIACIEFAMANIGTLVILQSLQQTKTLQVIAVAGVSIPPAIYWLA